LIDDLKRLSVALQIISHPSSINDPYPPYALYRRTPRLNVTRHATMKNTIHAVCTASPCHIAAPLVFCKNTTAGK
jgi:hypothetical protein